MHPKIAPLKIEARDVLALQTRLEDEGMLNAILPFVMAHEPQRAIQFARFTVADHALGHDLYYYRAYLFSNNTNDGVVEGDTLESVLLRLPLRYFCPLIRFLVDLHQEK